MNERSFKLTQKLHLDYKNFKFRVKLFLIYKIVIGTWMTDSSDIDFKSKDFSTDSYVPNSLWDVSSTSVAIISTVDRYRFYNLYVSQKYTYENEDFSFNIILKRKPLYFMVNNIFPTLILNCITLLAYSLPFASQVGLCKIKYLI